MKKKTPHFFPSFFLRIKIIIIMSDFDASSPSRGGGGGSGGGPPPYYYSGGRDKSVRHYQQQQQQQVVYSDRFVPSRDAKAARTATITRSTRTNCARSRTTVFRFLTTTDTSWTLTREIIQDATPTKKPRGRGRGRGRPRTTPPPTCARSSRTRNEKTRLRRTTNC